MDASGAAGKLFFLSGGWEQVQHSCREQIGEAERTFLRVRLADILIRHICSIGALRSADAWAALFFFFLREAASRSELTMAAS